jgi:hypothetical protein
MKYYKISESQVNNCIEVLEEWKAVIDSFIEQFISIQRLMEDEKQ